MQPRSITYLVVSVLLAGAGPAQAQQMGNWQLGKLGRGRKEGLPKTRHERLSIYREGLPDQGRMEESRRGSQELIVRVVAAASARTSCRSLEPHSRKPSFRMPAFGPRAASAAASPPAAAPQPCPRATG